MNELGDKIILEIGVNISFDDMFKQEKKYIDQILKIGVNYTLIDDMNSEKKEIYVYRNPGPSGFSFAGSLIRAKIDSSNIEEGKVKTISHLEKGQGGQKIERGDEILKAYYKNKPEATKI